MKNYLHFYDYVVWALAICMQLWMWYKLRYRRRSIFEIYLLFNVGTSLCLWLIAELFSARAYLDTYMVLTAAGTLMQILVMIELVNELRNSAAIPTATFRCFLLYSLSLTGMLICLTFFNDRTDGTSVYIMANRLTSLAQVAVFISVVSFSAFWGMAWRRESGIIAGFGLIALVELVAVACQSNSVFANSILFKIQVAGEILGLVAWAKAIAADSAFKQEFYVTAIDIEKLREVFMRLKVRHAELLHERTA